MAGAHEGGGAMEITIHQHLIEQCVTMACASKANRDKVLWLSMAQSWMRLADEVARAEIASVAYGTQSDIDRSGAPRELRSRLSGSPQEKNHLPSDLAGC
jgi:hypothetical protein